VEGNVGATYEHGRSGHGNEIHIAWKTGWLGWLGGWEVERNLPFSTKGKGKGKGKGSKKQKKTKK